MVSVKYSTGDSLHFIAAVPFPQNHRDSLDNLTGRAGTAFSHSFSQSDSSAFSHPPGYFLLPLFSSYSIFRSMLTKFYVDQFWVSSSCSSRHFFFLKPSVSHFSQLLEKLTLMTVQLWLWLSAPCRVTS